MNSPIYSTEERTKLMQTVDDDGTPIAGDGIYKPKFNAFEQFGSVQFTLLATDDETDPTPLPADMTVKVLVSDSEDEPTWTDPVDETNVYTTCSINKVTDQPAQLAGDTGIVLTANECKLYAINANGFKWAAFEVSGYTSGYLRLFIKPYN